MKFSHGKIFLLGFGFFGGSVVWGIYNAFVPIFLANKFNITPALIGFFMTLDNIAALFIQPPMGAWLDRLRTPLGRRIPFIITGAPIIGLWIDYRCRDTTLIGRLYQHPVIKCCAMADSCRGSHAGYHTF